MFNSNTSKMLKVVLAGRPNVGKSSLFNALTFAKDALVFDKPGTTRDILHGEMTYEGRTYMIVDTGGLGPSEDVLHHTVKDLAEEELRTADLIVWVVDAQCGCQAEDRHLGSELRRLSKPILLAINKAEGKSYEHYVGEFSELGMSDFCCVSAHQKRGLEDLKDAIASYANTEEEYVAPVKEDTLRLAIVGRPNAGKSTLINHLLGENRVMVENKPGTTRDAVMVPFKRRKQAYALVDTAGIRKRAQIKDKLEQFAVSKSLQAIWDADIVVLVVDATLEISDQDLTLLDFALTKGRPVVIALNKWDEVNPEQEKNIVEQQSYRFRFRPDLNVHQISALQGKGINGLFNTIERLYKRMKTSISTSELNRILEQGIKAHEPPLVQGRRIKLKYAHVIQDRPLSILIHGNQVDSLPGHYKRYLEQTFREGLSWEGLPLRLEFRAPTNPYDN